jgi:hypothetical protein
MTFPDIYTGHFPEHIRDTFLEAVDAFRAWDGEGDEPVVTLEVDFEQRQIPISMAARLVWNCTDILPDWAFDELEELGLRGRTYARAAQTMVGWLERRQRD